MFSHSASEKTQALPTLDTKSAWFPLHKAHIREKKKIWSFFNPQHILAYNSGESLRVASLDKILKYFSKRYTF